MMAAMGDSSPAAVNASLSSSSRLTAPSPACAACSLRAYCASAAASVASCGAGSRPCSACRARAARLAGRAPSACACRPGLAGGERALLHALLLRHVRQGVHDLSHRAYLGFA